MAAASPEPPPRAERPAGDQQSRELAANENAAEQLVSLVSTAVRRVQLRARRAGLQRAAGRPGMLYCRTTAPLRASAAPEGPAPAPLT
jgi:hypothetical protein